MDDSERLPDGVGDLEVADDPLVVELADLKPERVVERAVDSGRGGCVISHDRQAIVPPRMATYDQLSAQQRAIVDLILKRGQSYDQLADTLGMPIDRVRELAHETLSSLAPVSAEKVDAGWRAQIADYLLNQQAPPEAASTRGHLRRSEAARAWSHSVLDSLSHLYSNGSMPTIPSGDGGEAEPSRAPRKAAATPRERTPSSDDVIRRRRLFGAAGIAALLLLALLVWPVGLLTGGDDDGDDSPTAGERAQQDIEIVGQVQLKKVAGQNGAGIAIITNTDGKPEINLQAALNPTGQNQAYEVWLYNSNEDAQSLGAQVTDQQGRFAGRRELPADWRDYELIDISRETVDRNAAHSGESVLQARIDAIRRPRGNAQQQQP